MNRFDALIRKVTKLAIGIPFSASIKLLLDMGSHNTVAELVNILRRRQELRT